MQNQAEIDRINHFLFLMSPLIARLVRMLIESAGMDIREKGSGLDLTYHIKSGEKELKFYLHNLLLEIATVDRDEAPLRFDERLKDFDFLVDKIIHVVQSKVRVIFQLLGGNDVEAAIENIGRDAKQFERVRIWRFDRKPSSERQLWS